MAPLVPPPPVINLAEAQAIEKKMIVAEIPEARGGSFRGALFGAKTTETKYFSGARFVKFVLDEKIATDEAHAIKIGEAMLEHRIAHHMSDDYGFLNDSHQQYAFISQETIENKMFHAALGVFISKPEIFHQGALELRSKSLFGNDYWTHVYCVLDDISAKPRMIHVFKAFSAASPPIESWGIEECLCTLEECLDCKTDFYCFSLKAKKRSTGRESTLVMCANHSKRLEGWLQALMEAGVSFTKEEEGADLSNVKSIFELSARKINSQELIPLSNFKGSVCLVVNVASK